MIVARYNIQSLFRVKTVHCRVVYLVEYVGLAKTNTLYSSFFSQFCCSVPVHIQVHYIQRGAKQRKKISMFHHAFFSSIMGKTPTDALFTQHYISLVC